MKDFIIEEENIYNLDTKAKYSTCPKCSHTRKKKEDKCLSLFWKDGMGKCNHCGAVIQLHQWKKKKGNTKSYLLPNYKQDKGDFSVGMLEYIKDVRCIDESVLNRLKISSGKKYFPQVKKNRNAICFNYFFQNKLINIKSRDADKNFTFEKGCEQILYNLDSVIGNDSAVFVEGEFDVASYYQAGIYNVVSVPNGFTDKGVVNTSYLDDYIGLFDDMEKIYIAVDNDEAGKNGAKELIRRLGSDRVYLVDFKDCKDANDYLHKYGALALNKTIEDATPLPLENVVTLENVEDALDDFFVNGMPKGITTGIDSFDEVFSTYFSQFFLVTGVPSSGKSEFVDSMVIRYNLRYGAKVGYCSPENKPDILHIQKVVHKLHGKKINKISEPTYIKTKEYINDNYFWLDFETGYDLDNVLKKCAELVKRKGCKIFVLDPFNKIQMKNGASRSDINAYTGEYLIKIDMFCKKYDALVILVAHPNKKNKVQGSVNFEKCSFYDVKGGGEFYDMSYHGIAIDRLYDEPDTIEVDIMKVKFKHLGTTGANLKLSYNKDNGRFFENGMIDNSFWLKNI